MFGQNQRLKASLHRELQSLPPVGKLRNFCLVVKEVECLLRQLEALGEDLESARLEFVLEDKLPGWVLEKLSQAKYANEGTWSFNEMRKLLRDLAWHKENVDVVLSQKARFRPSEEERSTPHKPLGRSFARDKQLFSSTLATFNQGNLGKLSRNFNKFPNRPIETCPFCEGSHLAQNCFRYRSPQDKTKRAYELRLCWKCLHLGHKVVDCRAKNIRCRKCEREHFTFMCTKFIPTSGTQIEDSAPPRAMLASPSRLDQEASQVLINSAEGEVKGSKTEVWMLCREVFVFNPEIPSKREKALVFFDVGSQKSFVDQDLANRLNLNMGLKSSF